MSAATATPAVTVDQVIGLWLHRQGLSSPRSTELSSDGLTRHLERAGALQLDTINVVDRAHHLTLWSRFGPYDRAALHRWVYGDRIAYEYWGHQASILPISHLPLGRRRMQRFPPESWTTKSWWKHYRTSPESRSHVLHRLEEEGPLESKDFEVQPGEFGPDGPPGGAMPLSKEHKRSLKLLWHGGRAAVHSRRHFRCLYDLAERVYPEVPATTPETYEDSWLLIGLSGNGIASERHLRNYLTAPELKAADRKRVIERNLEAGRVVEVRVEDRSDSYYARPEDLEALPEVPEPEGTTLICPFDSLLWQRARAEELLDFHYRIEIYVPKKKREFGYYVLPILHDGRLVGRLDPKLHRDRRELEIKAIYTEPGFAPDRRFERGLAETLDSLRRFVGADRLTVPKQWKGIA